MKDNKRISKKQTNASFTGRFSATRGFMPNQSTILAAFNSARINSTVQPASTEEPVWHTYIIKYIITLSHITFAFILCYSVSIVFLKLLRSLIFRTIEIIRMIFKIRFQASKKANLILRKISQSIKRRSLSQIVFLKIASWSPTFKKFKTDCVKKIILLNTHEVPFGLSKWCLILCLRRTRRLNLFISLAYFCGFLTYWLKKGLED